MFWGVATPQPPPPRSAPATEVKVVNLIPLNNRNYSTWNLQCQMALMKHGLWNIVNETEAPPQVGADEDVVTRYTVRRDKALAAVVLSVVPSLLYLL